MSGPPAGARALMSRSELLQSLCDLLVGVEGVPRHRGRPPPRPCSRGGRAAAEPMGRRDLRSDPAQHARRDMALVDVPCFRRPVQLMCGAADPGAAERRSARPNRSPSSAQAWPGHELSADRRRSLGKRPWAATKLHLDEDLHRQRLCAAIADRLNLRRRHHRDRHRGLSPTEWCRSGS